MDPPDRLISIGYPYILKTLAAFTARVLLLHHSVQKHILDFCDPPVDLVVNILGFHFRDLDGSIIPLGFFLVKAFYSTVSFDGSIIAGKYTDGVAWAASYSVTIDGDTMTWTNTADKTEVSIYTRCTLPDFTNPDIRTYAAEGRRFL